MLAARRGRTETVKALIEAGANVNVRNIMVISGVSSACSLLIPYSHKNKVIALMLAARGGHTETVKALIEAGADVNINNEVTKFLVSTEHVLIATLIHNREKRLS